jgi:tRNA threonylcarbamoyl adenosine modification protein (Sua5/YciO/YrdC/YwlC family)
MAQYFEVHPNNPQPRLLKQAAQILHAGGVAAVPTDSSYALVCHLDDKAAAERLRRIRQVDDRHHLTLLCRDLSELATYARVDNKQYRLLKLGTPGPYTFILEATKEVPRRLSHPSRRTIGLRVPNHPVLMVLLETLGLFLFVINALMFWAASSMLQGFQVTGFVAALIGSVLYSLCAIVIDAAMERVFSRNGS